MEWWTWGQDREDFLVSVDEEVHTAACPYCGNVACWCHTNVAYHDSVTHPARTAEEVEQAYHFYRLYQ